MSRLVYGLYCGDDCAFQPGASVLLDEYDGFFDQSLDASKVGDTLYFIVDFGRLRALRDSGEEKNPSIVYRTLLKMPLVTGHLTRIDPFYLHVDKLESLDQVLQRLELAKENESADEIAELHETCLSIHKLEKEMPGQAYTFACYLPAVPDLKRAIEEGIAQSPVHDFGKPSFPHYETPLTLVNYKDTSCVRVITTGPNYLQTCRVFDILDLKGYSTELEKRIRESVSLKEKRIWTYLLTGVLTP